MSPGDITDRVIIEPADEPVSLDELKVHLRIADHDDADEDAELEGLITGARQLAEEFTGRALIDQTRQITMRSYPHCGYIALRPPVISVVSFHYTNGSGVSTALADDQFVVEEAGLERRLVPAYGVSWPSARTQPSSIVIQYRAGYADLSASPTEDVSKVPAAIRNAIKLHAAALYDTDENMMDRLIAVAENLCRPYRVNLGLG